MARVYQSVALPFLFVTLTTAGYVGIPPDKNSAASAIINLMRNLGGSVGVSVATTALAWRTQFHHVRLCEHVSRFDVGPGSFAGRRSPRRRRGPGAGAVAQLFRRLLAVRRRRAGRRAVRADPEEPAEGSRRCALTRCARAWRRAWAAARSRSLARRAPSVPIRAGPTSTRRRAGQRRATRAIANELPSRVVAGTVDASRWWSVFNDPILDGLIASASTQSLDVQEAGCGSPKPARSATRRPARTTRRSSRPASRRATARWAPGRHRAGIVRAGSGSGGGIVVVVGASSTNLFQVGFDATWEPDLFGKTRRSVQAADGGDPVGRGTAPRCAWCRSPPRSRAPT